MTGPIPPASLVGRLKAGCPDDWRAFTEHAFVRQIADGSLPEAAFRHFLIQDYLFLVNFARAYALAGYKSETLDDIRAAAGMVDALVNTEMRLHVDYCARWGLTEDRMAATPEARANMAYTRFVLEAGHAGDLLDLLVALAPCVCGYAEIGARLVADPATKLDGNPYRDWIELYGGEEFQDGARSAVDQLERVVRRRASENVEASGRWPSLQRIFRDATRLEADFWQMGLDRQE